MNNLDFAARNKPCSANSPCEHCLGTADHETWCITRDPKVRYAYQVVLDPCRLTLADSLILHSLGVTWTGRERDSAALI